MTLTSNKFYPEQEIVSDLISNSDFLNDPSISKNAQKIIDACRENKSERTKLDAFLSEYGLDNKEGVALMCLAESILRIPDKKTRDLIISEKLSEGAWIEHLNKADSVFVNASTWGLLLAGKVVSTPDEWTKNPSALLSSLISKSGEFPIRNAVVGAMHILSQEFVMGRDFDDIKKIKNIENEIYSFDMLGEAARNAEQADTYYQSYKNAIDEVGKINLTKNTINGVSIKISALSPRYEMKKLKDIKSDLLPKLIELTEYAKSKDVEITIDAEEQDRLAISLEIIKEMALSPNIKNWKGFGIAVQAYGKRAIATIDWLEGLLENRASMHVRLVKGAYWDYEIKHAQIYGYDGYPVYTKKSVTDLAYLACAKRIFNVEKIYPKFATHNAHTISAIHHLGSNKDYEFQRLFGMGELLYKSANKILNTEKNTSIYAPIGKYKDLLPYLVRRLLENGANSSFINRLLDPETDSAWLARGPHLKIEDEKKEIPMPRNIFNDRPNSKGFDLSERVNLEMLEEELGKFDSKEIKASSIYKAKDYKKTNTHEISSLADGRNIGTASYDDLDNIKGSLEEQNISEWSLMHVEKRASILEKIADDIEANPSELIYYLMNEAGKTVQNTIDEIREAIDFLRYYAKQAVGLQTEDHILEGPTGEINALSYSPKGHILCISPWNFPVAILIGQISAALACGNKVTVKPSEHTSILGYIIVNKFHEIGVPKDTLNLILGDGIHGDMLSKVNNIKGVAFTGSLKTAKKIQSNLASSHESIIPLIAETGGINSMIVDSSALLEQATDDIIRSAFDSSGQRCSALRVLCVQDEIYDNLLSMIKGGMKELKIGNPQNLDTDIGPIISKTSLDSLNAYVKGFEDNNYSIFRSVDDVDENFIAPTIIEIDNIADLKDEQFGPILHIVRFKSNEMDALIENINDSGFGLTMGIHTRVEKRADIFSDKCNVGNIYINRDMVGAVVGSQPFGGQNLSGSGYKAGGSNYLLQFLNEKVVSKNSVAFGGNTELLNIQED
ncbi:bifunctional proline dehydrogenase/L-glutamate gamma-semialdehyde dehydrogenase PutA [Gammaproteobacteria bacterium]|nr:bifunctional proline dehydrogenase/L-glutamate gamma-semialdehyde dehydrogenase PutA [Gammaproteobacteria bacterium]